MDRDGLVEASGVDGRPEPFEVERDGVQIESHGVAIGDDASAEDPPHH
jgi:hypothetical protein